MMRYFTLLLLIVFAACGYSQAEPDIPASLKTTAFRTQVDDVVNEEVPSTKKETKPSEIKVVEKNWARFVNIIKDKTSSELPWEELTFWVNNDELTNEQLKKEIVKESAGLKKYTAAILLRRGFDKDTLTACKKELAAADEGHWHIFTRYGKVKSLFALELVMKAETDSQRKQMMAGLLYKNKGSEAARAYLLENLSISKTQDVLTLASYGLVDEVRSSLERLRYHPTKEGQQARNYLKLNLALRKFGGLTERELKEYKVLYTEARTVLQGFMKNYTHFKFDDTGRRLLVRTLNLLQREKDYREIFSEHYKATQRGEMLLWEMMLNIQENYVDDNRINPERLIEAAASGMATYLDRHCSYMGVEETRRSEESFSGEYVGLGAVVSKTALGTVLIESVFFGAPAHKAGIRSGDQIIKVGEVSTSEFTLNENVKMMRGKAGTEVTIQVLRKGWDKPVSYLIKREKINTPSLFVEEMPGGLIYAKLTRFIATSDEDLISYVNELRLDMKTRGVAVKGLILDLRDNGGGYLSTAVNICDAFLPENKLIVYSEGRNSPKQEYFSRTKGIFKDMPLTIIVNKGSASASEIVSGCMRDHKRATVVGERTFGKGSVQNLFPLDSMDGEATLRMTIAYYYLPNGECVHRRQGNLGGVLPKVLVTEKEETSDTIIEFLKLEKKDVFKNYVAQKFNGNSKLLQELATSGVDVSKYPDFKEWYKGLNTTLSEEHVLKALRFSVRERASEERGKHYMADWHEDDYLKASIRHLAKSTGIDLSKVKGYESIK